MKKFSVLAALLSLLLSAIALTGCNHGLITYDSALDLKNEDYVYEYNDTGVTVTRLRKVKTSITVPDEIEGKPVTKIGGGLFNMMGIYRVYMPDTVTEIETGAFAYCSDLYLLELPEGLEKLGGSAFKKSGLRTIRIPEGITEVPDEMCRGCPLLESVELPSRMTSIGMYAFAECPKLTEFDIPDGVTELGWGAFKGCTALKRVSVPDSVCELLDFGNDPFNGCTALEELTYKGETYTYETLEDFYEAVLSNE